MYTSAISFMLIRLTSTCIYECMTDTYHFFQVFAAYETGLAAGTSLKLHVTPRTSAREVIDLVVKQLNMAAVLKGKAGPVYGPEKLQDFCLVAVIGARERCLRDDFRPLQLQNPWRKGRLYVRLKHDVLAALQHSAKQPAYIWTGPICIMQRNRGIFSWHRIYNWNCLVTVGR